MAGSVTELLKTIEELKSRLDALTNEFSDLKASANPDRKEMADLRGEIATLKTDLNDSRKGLKAMHERIEKEPALLASGSGTGLEYGWF